MATIYDVARAADVTAATVSNVVTGKGAVGAKTRQRVEQAILELGYKPNMVARGLATSQTFTLGLVLPNIANPFYPEMALEVEHTARAHGYSVFLCNTDNDDTLGHTYLHQLAGRQVDGVIVMPGGVSLEDLAATARAGVPVVLCNWEEQDELPALPMVGVNFFDAGCLAARHLLALGHRRIGVIADAAVPHTRHTERVAGFAATLAAAGIPWNINLLWAGDSSIASGYAAAQAACDVTDRPSALFCTNDLMALGAIEGTLARGLAIPEQLSIVGVDDISISRFTHPPLTTVAIPKGRIAAEATMLLLQSLSTGIVASADAVQLSATLVERGTTAAVGPPVDLGPVPSLKRAQGKHFRHLLDSLAPKG